MNKQLLSVSVGVLLAYALLAQDPQTPPQRTPKTPEPTGARAIIERPVPASLLGPDADEQIIPKLNGLVIVASQQDVKTDTAPEVAGVEVKGVGFLNTPELKSRLERFIGKPVTRRTIYQIEQEIILYSREFGRPVMDVILVEQPIDTGVIQLWYLEGKVGQVLVENPGKKHFKDESIRSEVHLQPGSPIDSPRLLSDLDWLNRNPFRDVNASFKPGTKLGESDVILKVQDRFPLRIYGGYENAGTELVGEDRFLAGLNWGNAFGIDHQLNYQYTTDVDFDRLRAHSASYVVPLPWRHMITLLGSYVSASGDFSDTLSLKGRSYQASMRYSVPLRNIEKYQHEATLGFDFKRSDNALEFGVETPAASDTDVAQFQAGYTALLPDTWGQSSFGVEGFYSPGELTEHNNDEDFNDLRQEADAHYMYLRANAERITRLPLDFSWIVRGQIQFADKRLLPSEQLGIGGYATVRGYEERLGNGDEGYIMSTELRTPPFLLGNILQTPGGEDRLQFLAFFDYGAITQKRLLINQSFEDEHMTLYSAGAGLRFTMSRNFLLRFDYGWQLSERELSDKNSRAHISALASW